MTDSKRSLVRAYHDRTMHHPGRYARALGFMDWDSQPDPFRWYDGAPRVPLARHFDAGPRYEQAFTEGAVAPAPLDLRGISQLFADALGLSAWKRAGEARWALRINPSSGNLHPTEGYLLCGAVEGLAAGVYHYQPALHALERRAELVGDLPDDTVFVGLSSIYWRESWKYGERAFRYCNLDVGHALAAVAIAAAGLGWRARIVGTSDAELARLLGIAEQPARLGAEAEHPDLLISLSGGAAPWRGPLVRGSRLHGTPRALSTQHHDWPIIDVVHDATECEEAPVEVWPHPRQPADSGSERRLRAVLHQRRSAVEMDGRSVMTREDFGRLLERCLPGAVPFQTLSWRPRVHLLLFVHRVTGLEPGLYLLVRDPDQEPALRAALDPTFAWTDVQGLPLVRLQGGDQRARAAGLSCGQAIASDGAFAVAMLAEYATSLEEGAWMYRRLHWEAGAIGQVLYLEAEAAGLRGTGIGCFFDERTHQTVGLRTDAFRDVYHFTVGGPVEDERLETLPAYEGGAVP